MTRDIAEAMVQHGRALGAACVIEAEQLCRRSLKRIVRRPAPDALRERLCARLEAERVAQAWSE